MHDRAPETSSEIAACLRACGEELCPHMHVRATARPRITGHGSALGVFHRLTDARTFLSAYGFGPHRLEILAATGNGVIATYRLLGASLHRVSAGEAAALSPKNKRRTQGDQATRLRRYIPESHR